MYLKLIDFFYVNVILLAYVSLKISYGREVFYGMKRCVRNR